MAATVTYDRTEVIRVLEAHGVGPNQATGIADVLEVHVLPSMASKRGEASARGRLTTRINQAFVQLDGIEERVAGIDARLIRVEETMATKQDLADLRHDMLVKFGAMLAGAVGFLTLVQGLLN